PDKRALERAIQATMSLRVEERSIGEHIIQKRQALVLPVADEEKVCPAGEAKRGLLAQGVDVHSLLAAPLLLQGQVTGMLCLYRHNADLPPFDTDDAVLAQDLADRATLAISSARLFQQAQRAANRLHHLRAIDQAILTERPLVAIARAAATHIGHLAPTIRVGVLLVDLATQTSTILALLDGGVLQTPPPAPLPLMVFGVALETLLLGHTYLVGDVPALPEIPILLQMNVASQVRSFLQVPIMAD
ncbi:hypothetical protein SE17_40555, partial [Kouleothrix aurantiaca]